MSERGRRTPTAPEETLTRQWAVILALQGNKHRGFTIRELGDRAEVPRSTLYKYLAFLERAGVPITKKRVNGEVRYRLLTDGELPALGLTSLQVAAFHLARTELEHLAGSSLVNELDRFLVRLRGPEPQAAFHFAPSPGGQAVVIAAIERAVAGKRRLRITYRSRTRAGEPETVHVDPERLHVAERTPYLQAFCLERGAARTYKLARILDAEVTSEPASSHGPHTTGDPFRHSRKAWSGEPTTVRIRLDRDVAWLARDYPLLPGQRETHQPDGTLLIEAPIAGLPEALRWVLAWGPSAEVLDPPDLRALVMRDLGEALARYAVAPVKRGSAKKIGAPLTSRLARARQGGRRLGT